MEADVTAGRAHDGRGPRRAQRGSTMGNITAGGIQNRRGAEQSNHRKERKQKKESKDMEGKVVSQRKRKRRVLCYFLEESSSLNSTATTLFLAFVVSVNG